MLDLRNLVDSGQSEKRRSRKEVARELGISFDTVPNIPVIDGIEAARLLLARCWFDKTKAAPLLNALRSYHKEWDDKRQVFQQRPCHDWASHPADSFRYLAVGHQDKSSKPRSLHGVYMR